tara:strand:+ start:770 stop:1447 length:678 start_codon:yes stop_codon:yes gene_type:complete
MKHIIPLILITGLLNINCGKSEKGKTVIMQNEENKLQDGQLKNNSSDKIKKHVGVISTTYGDMTVEFFDKVAPKHVESFKMHVANGYYDGTIFHRVIPGFMIQGGDPNTKGDNKASYGTGGHAAKYYGIGDKEVPKTWSLPSEFNDIKHTKGILSMARSNNPNSGGSQFFICAADAPHLNGQYTVFGQVIEGTGIIEQIVNLPRDVRDNPNQRVEVKIRLEERDN